MDDALDLVLEGGLYGQHVAIAAHREVVLHQVRADLGLAGELGQLVADLLVQLAQPLAQRAEVRRGLVGQRAVGGEAGADLVGQAAQVLHGGAHAVEQRRVILLGQEEPVQRARHTHGLGDGAQLPGVEHQTLGAQVQRYAHVGHAGQRRHIAPRQDPAGLAGDLDAGARVVRAWEGHEPSCARLAQRRPRARGERGLEGVELDPVGCLFHRFVDPESVLSRPPCGPVDVFLGGRF